MLLSPECARLSALSALACFFTFSISELYLIKGIPTIVQHLHEQVRRHMLSKTIGQHVCGRYPSDLITELFKALTYVEEIESTRRSEGREPCFRHTS